MYCTREGNEINSLTFTSDLDLLPINLVKVKTQVNTLRKNYTVKYTRYLF